MKKRTRQKKEHLVAVWLPVELLRALDRAAAAHDTDRSKLIREAIRRHIGLAEYRYDIDSGWIEH
jgi:metal-responsive CopG/Arc/MetJ family transcriptional regulator